MDGLESCAVNVGPMLQASVDKAILNFTTSFQAHVRESWSGNFERALGQTLTTLTLNITTGCPFLA